jgi:hypothetical protein
MLNAPVAVAVHVSILLLVVGVGMCASSVLFGRNDNFDTWPGLS